MPAQQSTAAEMEPTGDPVARRPRVVRVVARLNMGGVAAAVLTQAIYGIEGFEQVIVAGRPESNEMEMESLLERLDEPVQYIPDLRRSISPGADWRAVRQLSQAFERLRPDIIETHTAKAGLLGRVAAALYNRRRRSRREAQAHVVHYFHGHVFRGDYFAPAKTRMFLLLERAAARHATDSIVVPCRQQAAELAEEFAVGRRAQYRVVSYGVEVEELERERDANREVFRNQVGAGPDDLLVGIVGRLEPVKNHDLFLDAAARVACGPHGQRVRFLLIGDGALRPRLEARALELGLREHMRFLGNRNDRERFLAGLDVVALTSSNEGYPVALMEAMALRRPIVSTAVGGVTDMIEHERTGLLVPSGDADGLARELLRLIGDPEMRNRLGEAGYCFVREAHHVRRMLESTGAMYRELLGRPASAR